MGSVIFKLKMIVQKLNKIEEHCSHVPGDPFLKQPGAPDSIWINLSFYER